MELVQEGEGDMDVECPIKVHELIITLKKSRHPDTNFKAPKYSNRFRKAKK